MSSFGFRWGGDWFSGYTHRDYGFDDDDCFGGADDSSVNRECFDTTPSTDTRAELFQGAGFDWAMTDEEFNIQELYEVEESSIPHAKQLFEESVVEKMSNPFATFNDRTKDTVFQEGGDDITTSLYAPTSQLGPSATTVQSTSDADEFLDTLLQNTPGEANPPTISESFLGSLMSQAISNEDVNNLSPNYFSTLSTQNPATESNDPQLSKTAAKIASVGFTGMVVDCVIHGSVRSLLVIDGGAFAALSSKSATSEAIMKLASKNYSRPSLSGFIFEWQQASSFNTAARMSGRGGVLAHVTSALGKPHDIRDIVFQTKSGKTVGPGAQLKSGIHRMRGIMHDKYAGLDRVVSSLTAPPAGSTKVPISNVISHNGVTAQPICNEGLAKIGNTARAGGAPLRGARVAVGVRVAARVAGRILFVGGAAFSAGCHLNAYIKDEEGGGEAIVGVLKDVSGYTLAQDVYEWATHKEDAPPTHGGTFSEAFATTHTHMGPNNVFEWENNQYTTNRAMGRDLSNVHLDSVAPEVSIPQPHLPPHLRVDGGKMPEPTAAAKEKARQNITPEVKKVIIANRDKIVSAAVKHSIRPEVLAALASRESNVGLSLDAKGYGDGGKAFGACQIDKRYHTPVTSGGPTGQEHFDQAAKLLSDSISQVGQKHPTWTNAEKERGGIAAYNFGVKNVRTKAGVDNVMAGRGTGDYSGDVLCRAEIVKEGGWLTTTPPKKEKM